MAKRVQVALTESIASLGKEGDLVDVAPGYARNFLLPYDKPSYMINNHKPQWNSPKD